MLKVPENDIWSVLDGDKLTEYVGSYNAVNNYTKHKGMDTIGKVLETRRNSQGYVIRFLSLGFAKGSVFFVGNWDMIGIYDSFISFLICVQGQRVQVS